VGEAFDPYYEWLGIPPKDQPPHYYRLLGIELFESNSKVIEMAANRQMSHLRTFQSGPHGRQLQDLLYALSNAKDCLLIPQQRVVYDQSLRDRLSAAGRPPSHSAPAQSPPAGPQPSRPSTPAVPIPPAMAAPPAMPANTGFSPNIPAPVYQQPAYQQPNFQHSAHSAGPSGPPPVPAPVQPTEFRLPILGLVVAALASLVIVLLSIAGGLIWSRLSQSQAERLAANAAGIEQTNEEPTPAVAAPPVSPFIEEPADLPGAPVPKSQPIAPQAVALPTQRASPSPLQDIYKGLTHWWGLHEVSGTRHDKVGSKDLSDKSHVTSTRGLLGTCARFSGKQFLQAPSDPSLQLRGNRTFAMWVKFSTMNTGSGQRGSHALLGKWSANDGHDYIICYNYLRDKPQRFEFVVWDADSRQHRALYSSLDNAKTNAWYFVVCQYDADRGLLCMSINDGILDTLSIGMLGTSDNPVFVGADHGPPWNSLNGSLSLLGVWSRLLSPAEITALYNQGHGVDIESLDLPK
jgi:hypothetical protein